MQANLAPRQIVYFAIKIFSIGAQSVIGFGPLQSNPREFSKQPIK
jgi:hypothetical protein